MEIKNTVIGEQYEEFTRHPHLLVQYIEKALRNQYWVVGTHISQLGEVSGMVPMKKGLFQGQQPEKFVDPSSFTNIYLMLEGAREGYVAIAPLSRQIPKRRSLDRNLSFL